MNCTDSNFMESSEEILCNVDGRFELSDSNVGGHYHVCDRRLLLWKATEAEFISMREPEFNVSLHKWATSAGQQRTMMIFSMAPGYSMIGR